MAATKTEIVLVTSVARASGAAATVGAWTDVSTAYSVTVMGSMTNGTAQPTTPATMIVEAAADAAGNRAFELERFAAGVVSSTTYYPRITLPPGVLYCRAQFISNAGNSSTVTCQAYAYAITG